MNLKSISLVMTLTGLAVFLTACSNTATPPPAPVADGRSTAVSSTSPPVAAASESTTTSSPTTQGEPVDKPFRAKMSSLCLAWLADGNKKPPPFYMGNPLALTVDQLPRAGAYLDSLTVNHDLVSSTSALGAPAAGADAWSTLRSDFKAYQQQQSAAIAAAKASDLAAWTTTAAAADLARDAILSDVARGGFPFSDPCQIVFTRGSFHGD